jgi:hypothetical protein
MAPLGRHHRRNQSAVCASHNVPSDIIAEAATREEVDIRSRGLEEISTALSPLANLSITVGSNETNAINAALTKSVSETLTSGVSKSFGTSTSTSRSNTESWGNSYSTSSPEYDFWSVFTHAPSGSTGYSTTSGGSSTSTMSESKNTSFAANESASNQTGNSEAIGRTKTIGTNYSESLAITNKAVETNLKQIESNIERLNKNRVFGMWNTCCYIIGDSVDEAYFATNTLASLFVGDAEITTEVFRNLWTTSLDDKRKTILEYLGVLAHPIFLPKREQEQRYKVPNMEYRASLMISSKELPIIMNMPTKSVAGVSVSKMAEFGRNIPFTQERDSIQFGNIYHMGQPESTDIFWKKKDFASHCFITGSSGSGKSNAVYNIIDRLIRKNIKFLCIEPAKGEYKYVFGGVQNINIFTTDPRYFRLLRINPFQFNKKINITEHIDRLVSTVSACWPLHNAMPAILKRGFERAYTYLGWDLNLSIQITSKDNREFPDFSDLKRAVVEIIDSSEYSSEAKGDYKGALLERINSLTTGFEQQIFCVDRDGVDDSILFDSNCIVDISNIGSAETKSLIMGMLIIKLQEFHIANGNFDSINSDLKHITILEEAHNILKRCAKDSNAETGNIQGASVKMLVDCIAEMRTYGEGFFIIDQSPTSVDEAAIKNTAVKIALRLPEKNDCEEIGNALSLSEEQIAELSKLNIGVAAIFCPGWQDTVLAKLGNGWDNNTYKLDKNFTTNRSDLPYIRGAVVDLFLRKMSENDFQSIRKSDISQVIVEICEIKKISLSEFKESELTDLASAFCNRINKIQEPDKRNIEIAKFFVRFLQLENLLDVYPPPFSVPFDVSVGSPSKKFSKEEKDRWFEEIKTVFLHYVILPSEKNGIKFFARNLTNADNFSKLTNIVLSWMLLSNWNGRID